MYINAVILITITAFTSCHCSWLYVQPFTYQETKPRLQLSATVLQTATHLQRNSLATIALLLSTTTHKAVVYKATGSEATRHTMLKPTQYNTHT